MLTAVYGVPDAEVGDRVMAAIQFANGVDFDPVACATFLTAQPELGPKWVPTYVRIVDEFPMTQTNKILKRDLVRQQWPLDGQVWWRPTKAVEFVPFTAHDRDRLHERFRAAGRANVLTS